MFSEPHFSVLQHQEAASLTTEIAVSRLPVDLACTVKLRRHGSTRSVLISNSRIDEEPDCEWHIGRRH
jgi:hypothetical protein